MGVLTAFGSNLNTWCCKGAFVYHWRKGRALYRRNRASAKKDEIVHKNGNRIRLLEKSHRIGYAVLNNGKRKVL